MVRRGRLAFAGSFAVALAMLLVAPSCGSGFLDGLSGGQRDAGAGGDAVADAPVVDARACQPLHAPPRPDIDDSQELGSIIIAMDAVRVDDANNVDAAVPPTRGLDLDQACTCPEPETCTPPPDAGRKACDGDGGTDNSLGGMFSYLGSIFADEFGPDFATRRIREGAYGALFSIGAWNRKPDDPKVVVSVFLSHGLDDRFDGGKAEPRLDGTDVWSVDPASISNGEDNIGANCSAEIEKCFPIHVTQDAYVSGGYLVAHLDIPLAISTTSGRIVLDFEDVTLLAKLEQDGSVFRMRGEFAGRWPVKKVLESLARVPVNDKPLCDQAAFFDVARQEVCANADLMADKTQDSRGQRCDAVSASISFSGVSASLGRIFQPSEPPPVCTQFVADCPQ